MKFSTTFSKAILWLSAGLGAPSPGRAQAVPRWQPHDFSFAGPGAANPFRVTFAAEVTAPDGTAFTMPGFFDGNGTWKIRVTPTTEGRWSLLTHSDAAALDGARVSFACIPNPSPLAHGALRVDSARPRHFVYEDGTPFLPIGYECDWLWALDARDPALPTVGPFLDKIAADGFNLIVLNAYAQDTTWRRGRTGPDDFGPPPLYAWAGSNDHPDHSRFNLDYWQHYDRVIAALAQRGLWAHILIKVYNKQVNWPANGSPEDDLYFRWLIARYAAFPNITWDLAKEAHYEKSLAYKLDRLRFLRAHDPYQRLLTVHDDRANYDRGVYNALVDYRSDQQHTDWRATMLAHRAQREWPVINTEFGYEQGPGGASDKTYRLAQTHAEVARRAWEIYFAGGAGVYYYTYTAWDVLRVRDTPPGYADFKHLGDFLRAADFARLEPQDGITSAGHCLADPGRAYAVLLDEPAKFTMNLGEPGARWMTEWFRPSTGERRTGPPVRSGTVGLVPPAEWTPGPVALRLTRSD